jgi:hypothetical protein
MPQALDETGEFTLLWELPEKKVAKSFASLITYPHSAGKCFENRLPAVTPVTV